LLWSLIRSRWKISFQSHFKLLGAVRLSYMWHFWLGSVVWIYSLVFPSLSLISTEILTLKESPMKIFPDPRIFAVSNVITSLLRPASSRVGLDIFWKMKSSGFKKTLFHCPYLKGESEEVFVLIFFLCIFESLDLFYD